MELLYSLMFSLSGTPVLWYGDELGMRENLVLSSEHSSPGSNGTHRLAIEGYGYRWFRVGAQDDARPRHPTP